MTKAFKLAIVRARHDGNTGTISDAACLQMMMTGPASVMRFWEESSDGHFDFLGSEMFPWVDITITAQATGRSDQARAAFAALRAREPDRDPLAGFDGAIVLTLPGRMTVPNPKAGEPGEPATIVAAFDGGSTTLDGLPVSVMPVMSSDHTFMCHELGHTLGFEHTFGLDNNGTDWNPTDATIIVGPEYGSPYDIMSSASFGSRWLGTGPLYSADPTFSGAPVNDWPLAGAARMGPNCSRANLHRWFPDALANQAIARPFPARGEIGRVRLAAAQSHGAPQLLVLHPADEQPSGVGRVYIEYRDTHGWDHGLDTSGTDLAQAGLVVHTLDDVAGTGPRVWYRGSVSVGSNDTDLYIEARPLVITVEAFTDSNGSSVADIAYRQVAAPRAVVPWVNASDGTMQLWVMNSGRVHSRLTVVAENGTPERSAAPWHIVGTGDFTGDGKTDFLWVNTSDQTMQIWAMDGERVRQRITVIAENGSPERSAAPWHVVGTGDFNGNGKADILWRNASDRTLQIWTMDGGRVTGRQTVVAEGGTPEHAAPPWHIVGVGDFTGNGKADILWHNASDRTMQIRAMDGARVSGRVTVVAENGTPEHAAPPWSIVRVADFNRDGKADILWLNNSDRTMQIWMMDAGRVARRVTVTAENGAPEHSVTPWSIVRSGVASGNRNPDILWHNSTTGEIQLWFMDGHRVRSRATVLGEEGNAVHIGPPWNIVASADFKLDGSADILWHNSATGEIQLWFMNGHRVRSRATVLGEQGTPVHIGPPWRIVASSDFNLDGGADILWHNSATGEIQLWFMNGHRVRSRATVLGETGVATHIGPPWSIVASSDFDLDGSADILWHNSATGELQLWLMDGHRVRSRATVLGEAGSAAHIGPPWNIVAGGDFDLDGSADILWHNSATGEVQLWFMNGHRVRSRASVLGETGAVAHIGPPWSIKG